MKSPYTKKCPSCSKEQTYRSEIILSRAEKDNKRCRACSRRNRNPSKSRYSGLQYRHVNGSVVGLSVKEFATMSRIPLHRVYSDLIHGRTVVDGWSVVPSSLKSIWR